MAKDEESRRAFPAEAVNIISREMGPARTQLILEKLEAAGFSIRKEASPAK